MYDLGVVEVANSWSNLGMSRPAEEYYWYMYCIYMYMNAIYNI